MYGIQKILLGPRAGSGASGLERLTRTSALGPGVPPTTMGQSKIQTATCSAKSASASDPPRGCRPCNINHSEAKPDFNTKKRMANLKV
jgi:hypothetical protein